MMIDVSFFLLGLNVNALVSSPGSAPVGSTADAFFKAGTFEVPGNSNASLSDLFVQNLDWASFDPAGKIIPGVGYVGDPVLADGPTIAASLATNFLANGYTLVADITAMVDGASFGSDFLALPSFDPDVSFVIGSDGTAIVNNSTTTGQHAMPIRLAATLTPSRVACSINGDDTIEDTFTHTGFTNVVLSFNGSTVERVTFYPPKTNAELKVLSAH